MKNITNLDMFIKVYEKQANAALKEEYLKKNLFLKTEYVPVTTKLLTVESVVRSTMIDPETGLYKDNRNLRYVLFHMNLFSLYFNIDCDFENSPKIIADYDVLKRTGFFAVLYSAIPGTELKEFISFLKSEEISFEKSYNSLPNYLNSKIAELNIGIEEFKNQIEELVKNQVTED